MNNQYMSEEKYQKTKKVMKRIAFISIGIAVVFLVVSFILPKPSMGEEGWFDAETKINMLRMGSFVFGLMIPMPLLFMAHGRDIAAFQAQSMMPVAKEGIKEMAPTMGEAAGTMMKGMAPAYKEMAKEMAPVYGEVAKEISKGVAEGINETNQEEEK